MLCFGTVVVNNPDAASSLLGALQPVFRRHPPSMAHMHNASRRLQRLLAGCGHASN